MALHAKYIIHCSARTYWCSPKCSHFCAPPNPQQHGIRVSQREKDAHTRLISRLAQMQLVLVFYSQRIVMHAFRARLKQPELQPGSHLCIVSPDLASGLWTNIQLPTTHVVLKLHVCQRQFVFVPGTASLRKGQGKDPTVTFCSF